MSSPFGQIEPTIGAPMNLMLLLSDPFAQYRDGTTTRVYRDLNDRVVVVTSCDVKTAFLKKLALVPGGVPRLPVVHRYIGPYAKDADDSSLWGECFEVEELDYPLSEDAKSQQHRFTESATALIGLDYGVDPVRDASLATELARANIEGTGAAFEFIANFMQEHPAVLDSLVPRNVMFTKAGRLCLADAVSYVPPPLDCDMDVFPGSCIRVNKRERSAKLIGTGIRDELCSVDGERRLGAAAANAIESLLLALAAAGYDFATPAAREAIKAALESSGKRR